MQSKAKDVATYIKQSPADRQEALVKLRRLCRQVLKGFKESMAYGGPCYSRKNIVEVGCASQKNYILRQDALETQRPLLTGLSVGKDCIGYSRPDMMDFAVIRKLLAPTRDSQGEIC